MQSLASELNYQPVELRFGTSGLRGLVTDMTDLECYINTRGFLQFLDLAPGSDIYIGGDLRTSTPQIMRAVQQAISDSNHTTLNFGLVPTPTLAFHAAQNEAPCIMVTGSHIPADRNGIKFYKPDGEVLKSDETAIKQAVAAVRERVYATDADGSQFDADGTLKTPPELSVADEAAKTEFMQRYQQVFDNQPLSGKQVVVYQHSAVGRDMLADLLEHLGADVVAVGRSEEFVPLDSENVTAEDRAYFKKLIQEHKDAFAIVSTDGDSDRPLVIDETGTFHRGDLLGVVVAEWLEADFAAYPVSSNDAVDIQLTEDDIDSQHTKIGSPYVIEAMRTAIDGSSKRVVGWEVNGGFLLGGQMTLDSGTLEPLQTRDAFLPIFVALIAAVEAKQPVSELFAQLPARYTQAGLIDDFPTDVSGSIIERLGAIEDPNDSVLSEVFAEEHGFDEIVDVSTVDGVRIRFANGDITHLRPSGNAPQFRVYSIADSQARADEIVELGVAEPDGLIRQLETKPKT